ncbi:MAG TPA: Do family serine endopeptidase [Candidatus Acidoferrales bacterium]|nr:Do family serine endopeptidase [Candidatus Acidoferrales bacterium]
MGIQFLELVAWVRNRKIFASVLLLLTLGIGIIIGTLIPGRVAATRPGAPSNTMLLTIPDPVNLSNGFSNVVARVEPAVVNISTTQVFEAPKDKRGTGARGQDPFQDFFNKFFSQNPGAQGQGPEAERSLGSGVIVDRRGYVLTNDHVIDGATKIEVAIDGDPKYYTGKVIGVDKQTDLAVVKIETDHELPVARLGNSEGSKVGDWVLAFGSPFSLNGSVTAGIISATNRQNVGNTQFQNFIQTDAAINPGNSGGPLVNLAGEVIGINTAIYTGSRGFEGVGFALPSNTAINIYNQLVTQGHVTRGSIGIKFQDDQTSDALLHKELGAPNGVVVQYVAPSGPASRAGIQPGDVITQINGHAVHAGADLINPVVATPIGRSVALSYVRNGKTKNVSVSVADMAKIFPEDAGVGVSPASGDVETAPTSFGLHVEGLTPDISRHLGLSASQPGVVVSEVDPTSFADDIKFLRGDVIVEINHVAIANLQDYKQEIARLKPGEDVLFKVVHPDGTGQQYTVFRAGTIPRTGQ